MFNKACNNEHGTKWANRIAGLLWAGVIALVLVSCGPADPSAPSPIFLLPGVPPEQPAAVISEDNVDDLEILGFCGMGFLSDLAFSPDGTMVAVTTRAGLYLQNLERLEERRFVKTAQVLRVVAFSPDGKTLASGSMGYIHLWRIPDFKLLKTLDATQEPMAGLKDLAFSPDGKLLASGSSDGTIQLWDVQSGTSERSLRVAPDWSTGSLTFSPDGKVLAGIGYPDSIGYHPYKIHVWSTVDDSLLSVVSIEDEELDQVVFLPDSTQIMTASWARKQNKYLMQRWNVTNGNLLETLEHENRTVIGEIALAADLSTAAVIQPKQQEGIGREILYLNPGEIVPGPDELIDTYPHISSDARMLFSPDGRLLAVFEYGGFQLWEVATHRLLLMRDFSEGSGGLSFSPDGRFLAADSIGYHAKEIWSIRDCEKLEERVSAYAEFLPDGKELIGVRDNIWKIYDLSNGEGLRTIHEDQIADPEHNNLHGIELTRDGLTAAAVSHQRVIVRRVADGSLVTVIDAKESMGDLAFSPDGKLLAVGNGSFISLYDIPEGALRQEIRAGYGRAGHIEFSPDGKTMSSIADKFRVWNVLDGSMLYEIELEGAGHFVLSPDGSILAGTLKRDANDPVQWDPIKVGFWRASDGHRLGTLDNNSPIVGLAFSPDGKILAVSSEGGTILFWGIKP